MKPETSKLIAEAVWGYSVYEGVDKRHSHNRPYIYYEIPDADLDGIQVEISPENNPAQREKIFLWLTEKCKWKHRYVSGVHIFRKVKTLYSDQVCDKDYTTALLQAAVKEVRG